MLKSFSLKFQQSYKSLWGNKRGRTRRRNTKLLQDLDPIGSPHTKGIWLGGIVDLDLLFIFPQEYARIMGGIGRKASSRRSTMEERESKKTDQHKQQPLGEEGGLL